MKHRPVLQALVAALLLWAPFAAAQQTEQEEQEAYAEVTDLTLERVRLAFPKAIYDNTLVSGDQHAAQEIEQALRDDLEYSRIFNVQGPTELSVLTLTGERTHDFEQYRSLNNDVVLLATIKREADKLVLEGRVYDLPSQQSITGKRYRGLVSQARRIAHSMADELYYQFSGRPGIALTTIAFQSDRDGENRQELYLMDYDGRNQRRISAHKSTSGYSSWSPTGDVLAYVSYFQGNAGIYYVDLDTSRKVPIYTDGVLNLSPSFSPDGSQIAFAHAASDSNVDVYLCARSCQSPRRITNARGIDTNPAWSPDGEQIAFTSDRSGRPNVYVMDTNGANVRRISFEGDYNEGANWRPDGTHLVYASRRERAGPFQVVVTNLVDLQTRVLTRGSESHEEPSYSPDGRRILYTARRGRNSQIHAMDADGTNARQLTQQGNNMGGAWSSFAKR